jgi:hypothetical protein
MLQLDQDAQFDLFDEDYSKISLTNLVNKSHSDSTGIPNFRIALLNNRQSSHKILEGET